MAEWTNRKIQKDGVQSVSRELHVTPTTVARVAAGCDCHEGTISHFTAAMFVDEEKVS